MKLGEILIGGAVTIGIITALANFLAGALPSFMTIGRFAADAEDVQRLRDGEKWAFVPIVAVGLGAGLVFKSWWVIITTGVTAAYYYVGYERHIRNPSTTAEPINADNNANGHATNGHDTYAYNG